MYLSDERDEAYYNQLTAQMPVARVAQDLADEQVGGAAFNAYLPPGERGKPAKDFYILTCIVVMFLLLTPPLFAAMSAAISASYVSAIVIVALTILAGSSIAFFTKSLYSSSLKLYNENLITYNHWLHLKSVYFASVSHFLPMCLEPIQIEHDSYHPRKGEILFFAKPASLLHLRDRVISRTQSYGQLHQASATIEHLEGHGLMCVTSKGINFISDDHRSNIFLKWNDIAMISSDEMYLVIQPYSGKVRHIVIHRTGVDPTCDPVAVSLYIDSVMEAYAED